MDLWNRYFLNNFGIPSPWPSCFSKPINEERSYFHIIYPYILWDFLFQSFFHSLKYSLCCLSSFIDLNMSMGMIESNSSSPRGIDHWSFKEPSVTNQFQETPSMGEKTTHVVMWSRLHSLHPVSRPPD